jgi:hypothetical protein
MSYIVELGNPERLKILFSYPNLPGTTETLAETIHHWFQQTLERDNLTARGARATVRIKGPDCSIELEGPEELAESFRTYQERLPKMLDNGWEAFTRVIPRLMAEKRWDPSPTFTGPDNVYRPWRFFLTLGTALVHQRSLQFFHYPPIRLLEECRNYLKDPVPQRCEELLEANGVARKDVHLYEAIVDAVPIAAEDDQGSKPWDKDPQFGLIPIADFPEYQKAQVRLLLNPAPNDARYTIPIVVYGSHPRQIFEQLFGVKLTLNTATTVEILPGKKTPVMATNHPYRFYATAQGGATVGSGKILPDMTGEAMKLLICDLTAARWQKVMADDPSQEPQTVLDACSKYWNSSEQLDEIEALLLRQGSLTYPNGESLKFSFPVSMKDAFAQVAANKVTEGTFGA